MAWAPDYIDVEELKAYLRISDTEDDDELALAVTAASRAVDAFCNRQFGKTAGSEERFYTARYDYVQGVWVVDIDDVMTTSGMAVTVDGTTEADYSLEPANAAANGKPWTRLVFGDSAAAKPDGTAAQVGVTANPWGWTATPSAVQVATRLQASRFASRRDSPYGVAGSPSEGSEIRLLARVDPDVAVALRGHSRPRRVA